MHLPADQSRDAGCRLVSTAGLMQKMCDLARAQEWRAWDVAEMCTVGEGIVFYVKFHHRGCAAHTIAFYHMRIGRALPLWLKIMAKAVRIKWHGEVDKTAALGMAFSRSASLQHGQVEQIHS